MQKYYVLALAVLLTGSLSWGDNRLGLFGSYWDTRDAGDSFGAGGKVSVEMIPSVLFEVRGSFFNDLGKRRGEIDTRLDIIPLEAGLVLTHAANDRLELFGGGGLGYYFVDGNVTLPAGTGLKADPGDEVGFYLTTGLNYVIQESGAVYGQTQSLLFAEVLYRSVKVDDVTLQPGPQPSLADADLDGIGVNVGLLVKW